MTEKFLKAKHWQLFLMSFAIPFAIHFTLRVLLVVSSSFSNATNLNYTILMPINFIIFGFFLFGWFWSISVGLQKHIPDTIKMKIRKFKIFFFIPIVHLLFVMFAMIYFLFGLSVNLFTNNPVIIFNLADIIIILHLFSMFCIFYVSYFCAKTFKTVELKREVKFSDFAGEFCLLLFYPLGIWIIQPKINSIVNG